MQPAVLAQSPIQVCVLGCSQAAVASHGLDYCPPCQQERVYQVRLTCWSPSRITLLRVSRTWITDQRYARRVDMIDVAADRNAVWIGPQVVTLDLKSVRVCDIVGIEARDKLRGAVAEAVVQGSSNASVLDVQDYNLSVKFGSLGNDLRASVCRAIIYQNDWKVGDSRFVCFLWIRGGYVRHYGWE